MNETKSNDQDGQSPTREVLVLLVGTLLYLSCVALGVTLIRDSLLYSKVDFNTWLQIIVTGGGAAMLLLRFYNDPKMKYMNGFNFTLYTAASLYVVVSIAGLFAIYLVTHPDFADAWGFQPDEIPRMNSNLIHLWGCVILYAFSAFSIYALPDYWQRVIKKIKKTLDKLGNRVFGGDD